MLSSRMSGLLVGLLFVPLLARGVTAQSAAQHEARPMDAAHRGAGGGASAGRATATVNASATVLPPPADVALELRGVSERAGSRQLDLASQVRNGGRGLVSIEVGGEAAKSVACSEAASPAGFTADLRCHRIGAPPADSDLQVTVVIATQT